MSRDQNAGRSYSMKNDNSSFERVEEFKCLGTTLTYQNSLQGYTGCPGRNVPDFWRMFLKLKYTDITQNTYIQS